ncbi:MAG: hypothetical protein D6805_08410 [Planctomycetota bacterium]|nr:MAG: hypothetical protein D6805_08410 [Planctomycetota bacterium]
MKRTVLFVNNEEFFKESLVSLLRERGIEHFLYASYPKKAQLLISQADCVIAEEPEETSFELLRWIRSHNRHFQKPVFLFVSSSNASPSPELEKRAKEHGADALFSRSFSKKRFLTKFEECFQRPQLRTNMSYMEPFVQAFQNMCKNMLDLELRWDPPLYSVSEKGYDSQLTGVISFSGRVQGSLWISMEEETAYRTISSLMGVEEVSEEILVDGIGELTNIVAGNAKNGLRTFGGALRISIPNVIRGSSYHICRAHSHLALYTTFYCSLGAYHLNVSLSDTS